MSNNTLPALIVAAAIVGTGFMLRQTAVNFAGTQLEAVLSKIDESVQKKDGSGKTRLETIIQGASSSVAAGFKAGFSSGPTLKTDDEKLSVRDKLAIKETKIVAGQTKNMERVIGILRNDSNVAVSNVQLVMIMRDKAGNLIDVASDFARVPGTIKPGQEQGFSVQRTLGDFNEKEDVLALRKAATVSASVSDLSLEK